MTKRQAKIIVQLTTAATYAAADFWQEWEEDLSQAERIKVASMAEEMAWNFLARHGFANAPAIPQIIAYAKANF